MRKSTYYKKREYKPDHKYGRIDIGRFINYLMKDGKKSTAEKILYSAFDIVEKKTKEKSVDVFEKAITNASPKMEVVSRRVGGANYQIPREVRTERKFYLACKWIIDAARSKSGTGMPERLAEEIISAYNNEGSTIKKKQDMHRMAEANRAFASFLR
jgi:small subunit ribosomal protein S7